MEPAGSFAPTVNDRPCWTIRGTGRHGHIGFGRLRQSGEDLAASNFFENDGNWHQYIGTFDAATGIRNLYVDGMLAAQETNSGAYNLAPVEHLCFGAQDSSGSNFGNFSTFEIYDVRIYNYEIHFGCAIPLVIPEPVTTNVQSGQTVQLGAPSGIGNCEWTSNGVPILGADTSSLTITNVTVSAVYVLDAINECDETYPIEIFNLVVWPPPFSGNPVLNGNQVVLTWSSGALLEATNLAGPWTPVAGATSPYTNNVMVAPQMFFKLQ